MIFFEDIYILAQKSFEVGLRNNLNDRKHWKKNPQKYIYKVTNIFNFV